MGKFQLLFFIVTYCVMGMGISFGQGDRCETIQPFCAGTNQYVFPNSHPGNSNQASAQPGPYYACLSFQPYPAWFFLQVETSGDLEFLLSQNTRPDGSGAGLDVDFIVWGPFLRQDDFCSSESLSADKVVDCSYSALAVETVTIRNARADEFYVVMITNFAGSGEGNSAGYIQLQQTNTTGGSTDCSIVGSALGPDLQICGEEQVILDATNEQASEYRWYIFNESISTYELLPGETGPTLTVTETGNYQVTVFSEEFNSEASDDILVEFFDIPEAFEPSPVYGCAEEDNYYFDLYSAGEELIGPNEGDYSLGFYSSTEEYESGNQISNPVNFQGEDGQILYATIINEATGCESMPVELRLVISPPPDLEIDPITAICVTSEGRILSPVSLGEDLGGGYIYQWDPVNDPDGNGVQNPVFNITELPRQEVYTLRLIDRESGCEITYRTEMKIFSQPVEVVTQISGSDFEGGYTVTATAIKGIGEETSYEYRLDNGEWQENPTFTGVGGGTHRIYAREINGCGDPVSNQFRLIGYPRFFTPNFDGYNDTWNVINDANSSIRSVHIFDRYGKLLKEINPNGKGWDGTFNGREMPADDYWFLIKFEDIDTGGQQEFKGHFTLRR